MPADKPIKTALNPGAPADERYDAQIDFMKAEGTLQQAMEQSVLANEIAEMFRDAQTDAQFSNEMLKASRTLDDASVGKKENRTVSAYIDRFGIFASGDYYEKPAPVGYTTLRTMVDQTPILSAIVMNRIRQVSSFARPRESLDAAGYVIRHRDPAYKMTKADEKQAQEVVRFINNCGDEPRPRMRKRLKRDNFQGFLAKLTRDTLTMDASPIEVEYKRAAGLGMSGFYSVDGATIRLCQEQGYQGDDEIFALQLVDMRPVAAYTYENLIYEVRNPRTDIKVGGYGLGEPELLVRVVTGFLNAMTINAKGFDENAIPNGVLHLTGEYDTKQIEAFRRLWNAMVKGINNRWALPIMVSSDPDARIAFEKFGVEFNEMMFAKWMTFLTALSCAIYGTSPDEINFESFASQKSSLSGGDTQEKLLASKDNGLTPLMSWVETTLSDNLVSEFNPDFVFRFEGVNQKDLEQDRKDKKDVLIVNELRQSLQLGPINEAWGNAPVNPALISVWQQSQAQAGQPGEEDFGQIEGDDGGEQKRDGAEEKQNDGDMLPPRVPKDKVKKVDVPAPGGGGGEPLQKSITIWRV